MEFKLLLIALAALTPVSASCAYGTSLHPREEGAVKINTFGYSGAIGPANWHSLSPANALCAQGTSQSPVSMTPTAFAIIPAAELSLKMTNQPATLFENLGTTVEVVAEGAGNMDFMGVKYTLKQFHFHLPSEHLDNGASMAMEVHCVFGGEGGQVAVVGIWIDIDDAANARSKAQRGIRGRALPAVDGSFFHVTAPQTAKTTPSVLLETVLASVSAITVPGTSTMTSPLPLSGLATILNSGSFQTYSGSLTTPPCTEGVRWLVSDQRLSIKTATYIAARKVIGFNSRFPQNDIGGENILALAGKVAN